MTINGLTLKEIKDIYVKENGCVSLYKKKIVNDYFEGDYSWGTFEAICNSKKIKHFFSDIDKKELYEKGNLVSYEGHLKRKFPEIFDCDVSLVLQFNLCFNCIAGSNKQLEFNFG